MTDRERLIKILRVPIYPHELADPAEVVADYLLDNGVTFVPDNNVGNKVTPSADKMSATDKDTNVLTNADRIRSMTDIDLAEFLCSITDCYDGKCPAAEYCRSGHNGMKVYLKQRAEEE